MLIPMSAGLAGGAVGAIIVFLTTILGMMGGSKSAKLLQDSFWGKLGYKVNFGGAIWGAILGFIYGFVIWWIFAIIYNSI